MKIPTFFPFLQQICTIDPNGPYRIAGYSFGAMVALELAAQLQASRPDVVESLILLDGSHQFIDMHTKVYRQMMKLDSPERELACALCSFIGQFTTLAAEEVRFENKI